MRSSRALLGILSSSVLVVGLAACTAGGGDAATGDGTSFSYRIPDRFKNWLADDNWNEPLQKGAGVSVNVVDGGPEKQHYQQLDLLLSSGDLEDATVATMSQAQVYGTQGAFLNLAPLIDSDAPHLKAYIDAHPDFKSLITNSDGSIYGLVNEYPTIGPVSFYRQDMFADAGITSAPTSIEDYTKDLETLKGLCDDLEEITHEFADARLSADEWREYAGLVMNLRNVHDALTRAVEWELESTPDRRRSKRQLSPQELLRRERRSAQRRASRSGS